MTSKLIGAAAAAIAIAIAAVGCGSGGTPGPSPKPRHSVVTGSPVITPTGTFGAACVQIPTRGADSLSGMAEAPVGTATARNPLLVDLAHAVQAAGLVSTLNSAKAITVFAPDNYAFASFGSGNVQTLMASKADLRRVLEYGIVNGRITPAELATGVPLKTLIGTTVRPTVTGTVYKINTADVVCGNIQTENATVYVVDKLLFP